MSTVAAQKTLMQTPENEVRKFGHADVAKYGLMLLPRLREAWPKIGDANFAGHLRQLMGANDKLLVHTGDAVGLSDITYDPFDSTPVVRVVFVWSFTADRQEGTRQVVRLIRAAQAWAESLKAKRVEIGEHVDIDPGVMKAQIAPTEVVVRHVAPRVHGGGRRA